MKIQKLPTGQRVQLRDSGLFGTVREVSELSRWCLACREKIVEVRIDIDGGTTQFWGCPTQGCQMDLVSQLAVENVESVTTAHAEAS